MTPQRRRAARTGADRRGGDCGGAVMTESDLSGVATDRLYAELERRGLDREDVDQRVAEILAAQP